MPPHDTRVLLTIIRRMIPPLQRKTNRTALLVASTFVVYIATSACSPETEPEEGTSASGGSPSMTSGSGGIDDAPTAGGMSNGGGAAGNANSTGGGDGNGGQGGTGGMSHLPCSSSSPLGCSRGLYVSPLTDHIGQVNLTGEDAIYANLLGDETKEQHLIDFMTTQGFTAISLYNLNVILADPGLSADLASLMTRLREAGVSRIEAIGANYAFAWDDIHEFHESVTPFDGFLTEIEFWQDGVTFGEFIETLEYVRSLDFRNTLAGGRPTLGAYLGWPTSQEVEAMAPLLDRALIHVYVKSADQAYGYGAERFDFFQDANETLGTSVELIPIFSAEGTTASAGAEVFMGDWLAENGIVAAEAQFLADWDASDVSVSLLGFQFYEYVFLDKVLP